MKNQINSYKDLIVWQRSVELVREVYKLTKIFPKQEQFGLAAQMQRAAVSIPANIAEGYQRGSKKEYRHFLFIGFGSGAELETHIVVCKSVLHLANLYYAKVDDLLAQVMRMLNRLTRRLV